MFCRTASCLKPRRHLSTTRVNLTAITDFIIARWINPTPLTLAYSSKIQQSIRSRLIRASCTEK